MKQCAVRDSNPPRRIKSGFLVGLFSAQGP